MHSHGVIADTDAEAREIGWKYIKKMMDQLGVERGWSTMSRDRFEFEVTQGSYYIGSPETVVKDCSSHDPNGYTAL